MSNPMLLAAASPSHSRDSLRGAAPFLRWAPFVVLPSTAYLLTSAWPRWAAMWAMAFAVYASCKWLAMATLDLRHVPRRRVVAFALVYPGMNAEEFCQKPLCLASTTTLRKSALSAFGSIAAGLALLYAVAPMLPAPWTFAKAWAGMAGIVLVLHFGLLHVLACIWKRGHPLMDRPVTAEGVGEFWGRRWNSAFRDLAMRAVFLPAARRWGAPAATFTAFLFSGLVHDAVISLPAGGGYGLPTLYFVLQALAVLWERNVNGDAWKLGHGVRGRLFAVVAILAPSALLFHAPFRNEVVLPLLRAIGSL